MSQFARLSRLVSAALFVALAACGSEGAVGPAGPQGAQGPPGPAGPAGSTNAATFIGQMTAANGVDLPLPASATQANLPAFTCYIASSASGPWIVVPFTLVTGAPLCGVGVRTDGVVEIRLRQWIVGYYYYVSAVWK